MNKLKIKNGQRLDAMLVRNTFNEDSRTIDVVFATGAPVKRFDWFEGEYIEKLSMKKSHIRMDRLKSGAPVLNNHANRTLNDIIGVVESARIEDEQGVATLRLSTREELKGIVEDIKNGIIKNISVGYRIHKMKEEKKVNEEDPTTYLATDWEPLEVSFVTIPADASAQARSEDKQDCNEVVIEKQERQMTEQEKPVDSPATPAAAEATETVTTETPVAAAETVTTEERSEVVEQVRLAEKERIVSIRSLCKEHGIEDATMEKMIGENVSTDEARKMILAELGKRSSANKIMNHNVEVRDVDNKKLRNDARVRSILHRFDPVKYKLESGDRQFAGNSIIDVAREYLATEGNVADVLSLSKADVAKRALHHSSDFPELLANIGNKSLRDAYMSTPNTFMPFTKEVSRSDFKEGSSIQLSNGGKLEKVNEHGEYKKGSVKESAEKYKLEKFGKIIGHTWELMVNDDLDAFTKIPSQLGVRAKEKENELIWALLTMNSGNGQLMADGSNLFHAANHGNLGAGVINVANIGLGRKAMRLHKDLDGELISGLSPQYMIVPAALETLAEQFITTIQPDASGNVNPFANKLQLIVEPRLDAVSATAWYLAAAKQMIDMVELARLDGKGPEFFTREGFDVDGMEVKIRYVFGVKVIDYRGFYKSTGV